MAGASERLLGRARVRMTKPATVVPPPLKAAYGQRDKYVYHAPKKYKTNVLSMLY